MIFVDVDRTREAESADFVVRPYPKTIHLAAGLTICLTFLASACSLGTVGDGTDLIVAGDGVVEAAQGSPAADENSLMISPGNQSESRNVVKSIETDALHRGLSRSRNQSTKSTTTIAPTTTVAPTTTIAPTTTVAPTTTIAPTTTTLAPTPDAEASTSGAAPKTNVAPKKTPTEIPAWETYTYTGPVQVATVAVPTIYAYADIPTVANPVALGAYNQTTSFGGPTVFLVTENHGDWLKVSLPTRPNGIHGFIRATEVQLSENTFRAIVDLSLRQVTVLNGQSVVAQTSAVIGKSSTPTPLGSFYVNDKLARPNAGGAYGPFILGLSARSEALKTFNGGEAVIGLHGTNKPWLVGSQASNGCIRIPNEIITTLASTVPLGTPIDIVS